MAENRESVILQVGLDAGKVAQDLNALVTRIAALKKQQEDLNRQIKAGNDIDGAYAEQLIRVKDQLAWTEKQAKGLSATTKLLNADTMTYSDSLNGERQKLADMQKAYDELDADMRNSEGGKKLLEAIKAQSDAVKGLEEDTGRFGRNVGNYQSALEGVADKAHLLGDSFKATAAGSTLLGKGVDSVDKTMKVMTKNPLMGIVVALAPILSKIIGLVAKNESLMKALDKVLKPIGEALSWIADLISNALVGALDALSSAWDAAVGFFSDAADWLGITSSSTEETKVETDRYAESIENLTKQLDKQQKALEKSQKLHKYVIDYMRAAGAEQDAIAEQTLKYAQDEMHQRQKIYADAQKRVDEYIAKMREEGKTYTENGQEMIRAGESIIEEFRKIKAERDQAQNDMIESERAVAIQLKQMETDRTNAEKAAAEKRRKEREEQEKKAAATRLEIERATEDKLLSMETDATKKQVEQAKIAGQREIENLRIKLDNLKKEDVEARKKLQELIAVTEKATQKQIDDIQFKAETERQETLLAIKRDAAKRGIKDSVQLAQMQVEATQEDYARLQALTNDQIATLYGSWEKYATELNKAETAAFEARETLAIEEYNRKMQRLQDEYDARLVGVENEYVLAELEYEQKQQQYEALVNMDDETKAHLYANEEDYKNAVIQAEGDMAKAGDGAVRTRIKSIGLLGETMNSMATALQGFADESEEAAKAQKVFALSGILLNQAQSISEGALAIAKGVRSAAGIPFPANIPAIISVVAQVGALIAGVMTSITQAKQIFSQAEAAQQFEHGGVVDGNSYTGDKILIRANSGEGIMTGKQANNLLQEIANNPARGGLDYERMTDAFASAVAALPAPVMVYQEYKDFEQNVSTFNEIASI